jgi:hypothetical protein
MAETHRRFGYLFLLLAGILLLVLLINVALLRRYGDMKMGMNPGSPIGKGGATLPYAMYRSTDVVLESIGAVLCVGIGLALMHAPKR